jgi:predicted secreted protein
MITVKGFAGCENNHQDDDNNVGGAWKCHVGQLGDWEGHMNSSATVAEEDTQASLAKGWEKLKIVEEQLQSNVGEVR